MCSYVVTTCAKSWTLDELRSMLEDSSRRFGKRIGVIIVMGDKAGHLTWETDGKQEYATLEKAVERLNKLGNYTGIDRRYIGCVLR